jgi:hypothetical protein
MRAKEKLGKTVTIRGQPMATGYPTGNVVLPYFTVDYTAIVDDTEHPGDQSYKWLKLADDQFVNYVYPPNGLRFDLLTDPPPSGPPTIHHIEVVYTDGTRDKFVPE